MVQVGDLDIRKLVELRAILVRWLLKLGLGRVDRIQLSIEIIQILSSLIKRVMFKLFDSAPFRVV